MPTSLDAYGPYDSGPGANITETTWRKIMSNSLNGGSGVLQGITNAFEVFGDSTGLQVKVKTGECWIRGAWGESTAQKTLAIATAPTTASHTRKDRVVLRNDFVNNRVELDVLTGTSSAGTPTIPSCTKDTTKWETSLAVISVGNSVSTIAVGDVDDQREYQGVFVKYRKVQGATAQSIANATVTKNTYPEIVNRSADVVVTGTNNTDFQLKRGGEWTITYVTPMNTPSQTGFRMNYAALAADQATRYSAVSGWADSNGNLILAATFTDRFAADTTLSIYSYQTSGGAGSVSSDAVLSPMFVSFRWNGS